MPPICNATCVHKISTHARTQTHTPLISDSESVAVVDSSNPGTISRCLNYYHSGNYWYLQKPANQTCSHSEESLFSCHLQFYIDYRISLSIFTHIPACSQNLSGLRLNYNESVDRFGENCPMYDTESSNPYVHLISISIDLIGLIIIVFLIFSLKTLTIFC